jgi:uncharacterized RDD family membrane protein YckC
MLFRNDRTRQKITLNSALHVETPEGVVFSFHLASPLRRALAYGLDFGLVIAVTEALGRAVQVVAVVGTDWAVALSTMASFVISVAYGISLEWWWRGQTLGKRLLHLRVIDSEGMRLRPRQVIIRNLLRAVDMLPILYLMGALSTLLSSKAQRLGDLAAATIVIHEPAVVEPNLEQIAPGKYNSLLAYPHLTARLRNRVPPEAASLALKALSRRDSYDPVARLALFRDLAKFFRALVAFPEEAMEGLSDEQYVRSVICAIYSDSRSSSII